MQEFCHHPKLSAGVILGLLLHVLLICIVSYREVYTSERLDSLMRDNSGLQHQINNMRQYCVKEREQERGDKAKREAISEQKAVVPDFLKGVVGPLGPPGVDGRDGRPGLTGAAGAPGKDGKDFSSMALLRDAIHEKVQSDWTKLSGSLPTYSGSVFTRWGQSCCGKESKLIYRGATAGPEHRSSGGGSNYQCLPDDPSYSPKAYTNVSYSTLRAAKFGEGFGNMKLKHRVSCAVCETNQRVAQLMIPARTTCPSADWSLEYRGFLMSEAESSDHNTTPDDFTMAAERGASSYICVDENPDSLTTNSGETTDWNGAFLHSVTVACAGLGNIYNCPPYRSDRAALSCVVCSK